MPLTATPIQRESIGAALAKNLAMARLLAGVTQQELASASGISRATIAQLETGMSDPRLSTVVDLATALHLPPIVLLVGLSEAAALAGLHRDLTDKPVQISPADIARMEYLLRSGLLSDRGRAGRIGAATAIAAGENDHVAVVAGILSAIVPGDGTKAGISLGRLLQL